MSLKVWSLEIRSSILDTNFGACPITICRMPGSNSWRMLIPTSLPIVEPKLLKVPEVERVQYGRYAVSIATEVSTPRKYEVFNMVFPESFRVMIVREAAYITRPQKRVLFEG